MADPKNAIVGWLLFGAMMAAILKRSLTRLPSWPPSALLRYATNASLLGEIDNYGMDLVIKSIY